MQQIDRQQIGAKTTTTQSHFQRQIKPVKPARPEKISQTQHDPRHTQINVSFSEAQIYTILVKCFANVAKTQEIHIMLSKYVPTTPL